MVQVNTAPKLVLLDVGMVAELTSEDQQNLVGFFKVSIHTLTSVQHQFLYTCLTILQSVNLCGAIVINSASLCVRHLMSIAYLLLHSSVSHRHYLHWIDTEEISTYAVRQGRQVFRNYYRRSNRSLLTCHSVAGGCRSQMSNVSREAYKQAHQLVIVIAGSDIPGW